MKVLFTVLCAIHIFQTNVYCDEDKLLVSLTKQWADRLGADLWVWGCSITRKDTFFERFNKSAEMSVKDGAALVSEIEQRVRGMLEQKVLAVQRIMDAASNLAASAPPDAPKGFSYYSARHLINNLTDPLPPPSTTTPQTAPLEETQADAAYVDDDAGEKQMIQVSDGETETEPEAGPPQASQALSVAENKTRLNLTENPQFFNIPVNLEHSCVHVPSNVYDLARDVLAGIAWSEPLDRIFVQNLEADPTLSWQYFGSGLGFMRQFPAMRWHMEPVDAYDCRTRAWYIDAASSPKDLVVLVDRSGSMTGMQKEIAKHVVNNILDTLGNNDYVNIFTFSNITKPLVPCFNDTLVQANLANIRELKDAMDSFTTENIANFSDSLTVAFRLLENYRIGSRNKSGAGCNQAIMLITDGVQYNYKELFEAYNWRDLPYKPVRVFTYLIGREVSDVREVKWMACANQGYYVQLSTFAEVREQVLHYIPVLARPMVLLGAKPQPTWAPVYADVADPKLTNWLWTQRQRRSQRMRFLQQHHHHDADTDKNYMHHHQASDHTGELQTYTLMTSVSMPVYDKRQNANISEQVLVKEDTWITVVRETRVANLLGVAGTDVPIQYIQQMLSPHSIGVNGYAFIITNNGYILIHPDLRPVFQGILKPAYNRVDMVEVELPDDDLEPREFNRTLLEMRKDMVLQKPNKRTLDMKYHIEDMRRVLRGRRHFYYQGIKDTPFTLCVALPAGYGEKKVNRQLTEDIYIQTNRNHIDITKYFQGDKWRVHPDWRYCDMSGARYPSPEAEVLELLRRAQRSRIQWSHKVSPCERELVNSLVYEAKCSDFFANNISTMEDKKGQEIIKKMGFTVAFLATQSGLTRWQDFPQNLRPGDTRAHFSTLHPRAIDEIWYRRAVDHHLVLEDSFVYSVPLDAGDAPYTQLTASHAIFLKEVPVAVVGHQLYADRLGALLANVSGGRCAPSSNLTCVLLDEHAHVLVHTHDPAATGRWLGDVSPGLLTELLDAPLPVYEPVSIVDYQAVCFPVKPDNSAGTRFFSTLVTTLLYLLRLLTVSSASDDDSGSGKQEFDKSILMNKTRPTACDERRWLYALVRYPTLAASPYNKSPQPGGWVVQRLPYSNLVLLVHRAALTWPPPADLPSPQPDTVDYNMSLACRMREDDLPRRRYARCVNRHINESAIQLCGHATTHHPYHILLTTLLLLVLQT